MRTTMEDLSVCHLLASHVSTGAGWSAQSWNTSAAAQVSVSFAPSCDLSHETVTELVLSAQIGAKLGSLVKFTFTNRLSLRVSINIHSSTQKKTPQNGACWAQSGTLWQLDLLSLREVTVKSSSFQLNPPPVVTVSCQRARSRLRSNCQVCLSS